MALDTAPLPPGTCRYTNSQDARTAAHATAACFAHQGVLRLVRPQPSHSSPALLPVFAPPAVALVAQRNLPHFADRFVPARVPTATHPPPVHPLRVPPQSLPTLLVVPHPSSVRWQEGGWVVRPEAEPTNQLPSDPSSVQNTVLDNVPVWSALGLVPQRVLAFAPNGRRQTPLPGPARWVPPHSPHTRPAALAAVPTLSPYLVLDSPGLRNDFYSLLVHWCSHLDQVLVALGRRTYIWNAQGVVSVEHPSATPVTSVSFLPCGVYFVVACKSGAAQLFMAANPARGPLDTAAVAHHSGVVLVVWMPSARGPPKLYFGTESGDVVHCAVEHGAVGAVRLKVLRLFRCNLQQVCGLAINPGGTVLAVGGNDNCCLVWDIRRPAKPVRRCVLPHRAAVKALAFCPWLPLLLATGAGSKDRAIRFWHTPTGTLLRQHDTQAQVTALVWLQHCRQLTATFGFSSKPDPLLCTVYSYPLMRSVARVPAYPGLRALCMLVLPCLRKVCVASNDQQVLFISLWEGVDTELLLAPLESGLLGSDLIELREGISKMGVGIR